MTEWDEEAQRAFWPLVERKDGCWSWKGKHSYGYGTWYWKGTRYGAHRVSYEMLHNKRIAEGLYILHGCDNEGCVNPAHLREGTARENANDTRERGRYSKKKPEKRRGDGPLRAYVIAETYTRYTILPEHTKMPIDLPKDPGIQFGECTLPDGVVVNVCPKVMTGSRLFSALREYEYDCQRKKVLYEARKESSGGSSPDGPP